MNSNQQQQPRRMSSQVTIAPTQESRGPAAEEKEKENKRPQPNQSSKTMDENDDEVIPAWPSKQEQMLARNPSSEVIQHKIYSLKDYSQVASPTATPCSSSSSSAAPAFQQQQQQQQPAQVSGSGGKLLKSMSQDRKVKSSNKRMSECIYPASQISGSHQLFGGASNKATAAAALSPPASMIVVPTQTSSASFSVGQASSANTLLPAARVGSQLATGNPGLVVGESRIDRMRKLFVSPLSLRSSASGGSTSSSTAVPATAAALGGSSIDSSIVAASSGISKQHRPQQLTTSGGGLKPSTAAHHLMHAMHRSTGPTTAAMVAHHSRRSPMRQKQAKGFRVYGCPLQMANNIYPITCFGRADIYKQQSVPYVLARLCNYIEENSSQLTHEGIFRVSGNQRLMEKLRTLFDHLGDAPLESESVDVATSASMLKMYLRELPEPLIPTRMNYYFITLAKKYAPYLSREQASSTSHALQQQQKHNQQQKQQKLAGGSSKTLASSSTTSVSTGPEESIQNLNNNSQYVRQRLAFSRDLTKLIRKLPIENYNLLKYLACFLYRISLKQQYNKMCSEALGIVFGPNVFRIRSESYKGLKEQELSNQIMASIISNYKLIFDSELTDPLGNVVDGNESAALVAAAVAVTEAVEQQKRKQEPVATTAAAVPTSVAGTTTDLLAQAERLAQRAELLVPIVPRVSQTIELPAVAGRDSCCASHCKEYPAALNNDACDNDVDEDDDDDDGEESYTPSSGSSYCSSIDSETLESSYDGDIEGRKDNSRSTSECGSDTSYTPTSSHTDSYVHDDDDDEDDDEEDNESFDDQPSSSRDSSIIGNQMKSDCKVCKRRESLQITNLATVKGSQESDVIRDTKKPQQLETSVVETSLSDTQLGHQRGTGNRVSRRRRQGPGETTTTTMTTTKSRKSPSAESSDIVLVPATNGLNNELQQPFKLSKQVRQRQANPLSRRRSSSASSLNGHKSRRKNQRTVILNNETISETTAKQRSKAQSTSGSAATSSGCRRSRASGARRRQHDHHPWDPRRHSRHSMRSRNAKQATTAPPMDIGDVQATVDPISMGTWSEIFAKQLADEPACAGTNYDEPESPARYFLMRSFYSDETLLRSLSYCSEWPTSRQSYNDTTAEALDLDQGQSKQPSLCQRRRHSNFDYINEKPILQLVYRPCDLPEEVESPEQHQLSDQLFDTSTISLIDKGVGFRKSELSVNNLDDPIGNSKSRRRCADDAILTQMLATKDLIKALKKLLRHCKSTGLCKGTEQLLLKLASSEDGSASSNLAAAYSDDCQTCYVDHLSAKSFARELAAAIIDEPDVKSVESGENLDQLCRMLAVKITLFKQRYNDLKSIRDHYLHHHRGAALTSDFGHQSETLEKAHGSLDTLKTQQCQHPVVTQINPASGHRSRILSVPNRELLSKSFGIDDARSRSANPNREPQLRENEEPSEKSASICKFGSLCPVEFVFNIEKQLALKQILGGRVVKLNEMTLEQLQGEKLELQKNLLRYEHWFSRPATRLEFSLVGHLYERYRAVKVLKLRKTQQQSCVQ